MEFRRLVMATAASLLSLQTVVTKAQEASPEPADAPAATETTTVANPGQDLPKIPVNGADSTEPAESASPTVKNRLIEEVVVTAQKREERIQDVPISIQAFSGESLAAQGIATTDQLGTTVSGMQVTKVAGFTLIYLRGIGTDQFIPSADPSIAQYVDGVYVLQGQGGAESLANVKRVEVLKGPQGTLFGRNSTGGAISITTEEPGGPFKASAEAELGRFERRAGKLSMSGDITDWLSAGISGSASAEDNYYKGEDQTLQATTSLGVRGKINFHPMEQLSLSVTGYHGDQKSVQTVTGKNTDPGLVGRAAGITPAADNYNYEADFYPNSRFKTDLFYGVLKWDFSWLDTKLLVSDQSVKIPATNIDFDGSPQPIATFQAFDEYSKVKTAELQLLSNDGSWDSEDFKWVAGLYYFRSDVGLPIVLRVAPKAVSSLLNNAGITLAPDFISLINKLPLMDGGIGIAANGAEGTKSYSAYTQATYSFTEWLDLTLGARYQREQRYITKSEVGVSPLTGNGSDSTPLVPFAYDPDGKTASSFSPKAIISFKPRDGAMIYASYSVGFKSGTYNIVNIYTAPNYIVPEQVTTYELGAKVDLLGGRLRLNTAVFYNDIKNLQSGFVSVLSGGAVRFQTAGSGRTQGAEFDASWLPLPDLDPGLAVTANASYVDAKYTSFTNGSGFDPTTGIYQGNLDLSGKTIVRVPKLSGGVGIAQTIEVNSGSIEIAADDYYNSGFFYDSANTVKEHPYAILNGRISYLYDPWKFRVTVFGQNLLDRRYHVQILQTDFGNVTTLAPPILFGLRANIDF